MEIEVDFTDGNLHFSIYKSVNFNQSYLLSNFYLS